MYLKNIKLDSGMKSQETELEYNGLRSIDKEGYDLQTRKIEKLKKTEGKINHSIYCCNNS